MQFSLRKMMALGMVMSLLSAAPALASNGDPTPSHRAFLLLHFLGMILLMGNVIVSSMWMTQARKTGDRTTLYCASTVVARADWVLSMPGLLLILISGIMTVGYWGGFGRASWAELSLAFFALIGVIWVALLLRYQRRMLRLTREAVELKIGLSGEFSGIATRWAFWNGIVTVLLCGSLYLMVFKPHLWGRAG